MARFDPDIKIPDAEWTVESLIPAGHLCIFLAQAGVGKSLLAEGLAVCISAGVEFCGFKTVSGDTLIIDQDTPTNVLQKRLAKFYRGISNLQDEEKKKNELFFESMNGYSFSDGTIYTLIKDYPTVKLIVIDSFLSICGKYDPNSISDVNRALTKLKNDCLAEGKTIIINHHISEKLPDASLPFLMTGNSHSFSMSSSAIIQQADSYYIIGADAENGFTSKVYLRPIAKRAPVSSTPKVFRLIKPGENAERFEYHGEWSNDNLAQAEDDVLALFKAQPQDRSVLEVYQQMGHAHGENATRKALQELEKKGLLIISRHKNNLFKYKLP